jgi:hypothetical protein
MLEPGTAQVRFGTTSWILHDGELLAYGREEGRSIRIPDPRVSSRAGLLFMQSGCVWVRHDSLSHGLMINEPGLQPQVVPKRRAGTLGSVLQLRSALCELELIGSAGSLRLRVQQSRPLAIDESAPCTEPTAGLRAELTPNELRVLASLCEGLLRSGGVGEPASTSEVALRLGLSTRKAAEHRLARVRGKLSALGVEGLQGECLGMGCDDDPPAAGHPPNYVAHLGKLAYANGWVLDEDLALL